MVLRFFLLAILFLISCTSFERDNPNDPGGTNFIGAGYVPKGNNIASYKTKPIGTQVWMAENLDYDVSDSKCFNNNSAHCKKYGRLYDWATAMALPDNCNFKSCGSQIDMQHRGICPSGWHIPSDDDWDKLITAVGGSSTAGRYLKATSGWDRYSSGNVNGNGEDKYGFSALPSGYIYYYDYDDYGYNGVGECGSWWSASEDDDYAYYREMSYSSEYVYYGSHDKNDLRSVRCLQD